MDGKGDSRSCAGLFAERMKTMKMEVLGAQLQGHGAVDGLLSMFPALAVVVLRRACQGCVLLQDQ